MSVAEGGNAAKDRPISWSETFKPNHPSSAYDRLSCTKLVLGNTLGRNQRQKKIDLFMDNLKFQEILNRIIKPVGIYEDRFYTEEDVKNMRNRQLSEISMEMMQRYTSPGSYWLRTELFSLIDYLDAIISFPDDPNLEKNLHLTASLVCLAWMQNFDFSSIPRRAVKHLERVIGKHSIQTPSMEFDPSLQIATFLAYPLLEGVIRRKLSRFISSGGVVLIDPQLARTNGEPYKQGSRMNNLDDELKRINAGITQICDSLSHYGVSLSKQKLMKGDYTELNQLNQQMQPKKKEETVKLRMIDDLITLFGRYLESDIVPLVDKSVRETLSDLLRLKARLAADRVFSLLNALNGTMTQSRAAATEFDKIQQKIFALSQKSKDLKELEEIQGAYIKADEKYLALQVALNQDRTEMLSKWRELSLIDGDPNTIQNQLSELDVSIRTQETMRSKYEENLRILRENSTAMPKYVQKEKKLRVLYETISKMRENVIQWTQILDNPELSGKQFTSEKEKIGFGLADYRKFVRAVGEYLGSQFEPIPFDYKQHNVKFFDIEKNVFITTDDRQIHIDNLSQGQSKITSLTGSFKKMDPGKKKIVLVDEISELDPQNLEDVKKTLRSKLDDGSLLLAVLVRPSCEMTRIEGWG